MKKYTTLEVINNIMGNHSLKYTTTVDGKVKTAFYNKNGGISDNKNSTLVIGGKMLTALWEEVQTNYSFIEAVNSGKKIKSANWETFKSTQEALYDMLDYPISEVVEMINGHWNIEG